LVKTLSFTYARTSGIHLMGGLSVAAESQATVKKIKKVYHWSLRPYDLYVGRPNKMRTLQPAIAVRKTLLAVAGDFF